MLGRIVKIENDNPNPTIDSAHYPKNAHKYTIIRDNKKIIGKSKHIYLIIKNYVLC